MPVFSLKQFLWSKVLQICLLFDPEDFSQFTDNLTIRFSGELGVVLRIEDLMFSNNPIIIIELSLLNKLHTAEKTLS